MDQTHSKQFNRAALAVQRWGLVLVLLNFVGAVVYVIAASHGGWVLPQERGLNSVTGEPFVWALHVFPIWAAFLLLNLTWGAFILTHQHWRSGILWLMTIPFWVIAAAIDFAHH